METANSYETAGDGQQPSTTGLEIEEPPSYDSGTPSSDDGRQWVMILACCILCTGITVAVIYYGATQIGIAKDYAENATKETCEVLGYDILDTCTYQCNCRTVSGDKKCDSCSGYEIQYYSVAESKCGNTTLYEHDSDTTDCVELYNANDVGKSDTCYVMPCEDQEYSFTSPEWRYILGIILIVVVSCCFCCVSCCLVFFGAL